MKINAIKTTTLIVATAFVLCAFTYSRADAASAVGKITRKSGNVALSRRGRNLRVAVGTRVMPGDLVSTKTGARVKILMSDSSVLSLGPNSKMRIRSYSHNRRTRQTAANYDLVYGRGRARVPKRAGVRKNIRFRTPTAVAGVRGTELIIEYDPVTGQTRIIAVDGTVTVEDPNNPGQFVTLTPGMGVTVGADGGLSSAFNVPVEEVEELRRKAYVPGNSPRRVTVIEVPGTSDSDIGISIEVTEGGGINLILEDSGTVINPEDLLDQEPPPYTPVKINLSINSGE